MKKIIMVAVMVALVASAVGVGVHVLNKEARAEMLHRVKVFNISTSSPEEDIPCSIHIMESIEGEFENWNFYFDDTNFNGCFDVQDNPCSEATFWRAWVDVNALFNLGLRLSNGQDSFVSVNYGDDGTTWTFYVQNLE